MSLVGKIGKEGNQFVNVNESLEIPKNHFVYKVDLDCDEPYCIICDNDRAGKDNETKIMIPHALAYYLRTHSCGSRSMRNNNIERGEMNIINAIKNTLKINELLEDISPG